MTAASEINKIIVRQLQRHKLEYEIDLDPDQDNQEVVFCYDENLGQQRILKEKPHFNSVCSITTPNHTSRGCRW